MEKRLVRIYKSPTGSGEYKNKTKAFLEKAQQGMQVAQQKDPRVYLNYIHDQLSNETDPNDVFADLIANGLDKDMAYKLLTTVVDQMVEAGDLNADNSVTKNQNQEEAAQEPEQTQEGQAPEAQAEEEPDPATEYYNSYADEPESRPQDIEFQMGGYPTEEDTEEQEETDDSQEEEDTENQYGTSNSKTMYPGLEQYYMGYEPIAWQNIDSLSAPQTEYRKGGAKNSFVKNVLKLVKKEEGGESDPEENKPVGQGNKFDTVSDEVSNRKSKFMEVVKNKANTAKLKDIYEKMMKSGNPDLMRTAQTLQNGDTNQPQQGAPMMQQQKGGPQNTSGPRNIQPSYDYDDQQFHQNDPEGYDEFINGPGHAPDTYKFPNHPTFSKESMYSNEETPGGEWMENPNGSWKFKASSTNRNNMSKEELENYFNEVESGNELEYQQTGGYTGGENQPEMFMYGGTDVPFYEADYLPEAKEGIQIKKTEKPRRLRLFNKGISSDDVYNVSNAYNVNSKAAYTGGLEGYKPIERRVTKTGIFGRPKEWTDIYSNNPSATYQGNSQAENKSSVNKKNNKPESWVDITGPDRGGMSDEEWDDTGFFAKMAIRKGDRQGARNEKRYNKQLQKDREFEAFKNRIPYSGGYQFDNDEDYETYWNGLPEVTAMNPNPYKLKGNVYQMVTNPNYKKMHKLAGEEYKPIDFGQDPADKWHVGRTKRYQLGGLPKAQTGPTVKSGTSGLNAGSDATASIGVLAPTPPPPPPAPVLGPVAATAASPIPQSFQSLSGAVEAVGETPEYNTIGIDTKRSRSWDRDGQAAVNAFNTGARGVLGMLDRAEQKKQQSQMYEDNFSSDNLYAHSNAKDRGAYGAYGSGSGKLKPDQYNKSLGSFSVQKGGYMQEGGYMAYGGYMEEGGYAEGGVVDMTEEELEEFLANGGEVEYLES